MEKYSKKRRFGNNGEDEVVKDLENKSFTVIIRNYLKKWGEIDIIALKEGKLHFIEVKTVSMRGDWKPEENVHAYKLSKMGRTIETFLMEHPEYHRYDWCCDVACVYRIGERAEIEYIEDIII